MIWYDIWGDMTWYDIIYDMIWYMMWYDMIWYYMIWYDMIYEVIWHDMILYMIWYGIWCDMTWYDIIWYDMIYETRHTFSCNQAHVEEMLSEYVWHIAVNLWCQKKIGPVILSALTTHHTPTITLCNSTDDELPEARNM